MKTRTLGIVTVLIYVLATVTCSHHDSKVSESWDAKAAAAYLDSREGWWMKLERRRS
jgi:hypothetical protein